MSDGRSEMLTHIRAALAAGNRAGQAAALEQRGTVGYQGAGHDLAEHFAAALAAAGGCCHRVSSAAEATVTVLRLLQERDARPVLLGRGSYIDSLDLEDALRSCGHEPITLEAIPPDATRGKFFAAAAGVTGVDCLIAETGSVVLES